MIEPPPDVPRYMYPAWFSCLYWTIRQPFLVDAFTQETGIQVPSCKGGITAMIDEATGLNEQFAHGFAKWFHKNVWGINSANGEVGNE